jgi:hypothetical protein
MSLCGAREFEVDSPWVRVKCGERAHKVKVSEEADFYELRSVVARPAVVRTHPELAIEAWLRNRGTALVGFRIDNGNRLVAEAWVPKAGLTSDEFGLYLRAVAEESDWFEYQLTGRDVE